MVWDSDSEALLPMADMDQVARLTAAVHRLEFDHGLGPYPLTHWQSWTPLASHITPVVSQCVTYAPAHALHHTQHYTKQ
jgi:hypothetical protein